MRVAIIIIAFGLVCAGVGQVLFTDASPDDGFEPAVLGESDGIGPTRRESGEERKVEVEAPREFPRLEATDRGQVREVVAYTKAARREEISELWRAVTDSDDVLVIGNALRALGRLGAIRGDRRVLALVGDARLRVRQEAVRALGADGHQAAVPALTRVSSTDGDSLRVLALEALGSIGGEAARAVLETAAESSTDVVERTAARMALRRG